MLRARQTLTALWLCVLLVPAVGNAQPVRLGVATPNGRDLLFAGMPGRILFTLDSDTTPVAGVAWPLLYRFSNGNLLGPLPLGTAVTFSPRAQAVFESNAWNSAWGLDATNPDTTLAVSADFDLIGWTGAGTVWQIDFVPLDTGQIEIDSVRVPLTPYMDVVSPRAESIPFIWEARTIFVIPCPVPLTGDVNRDGLITAADIVRAVCLVFICPPSVCELAAADVNCSGTTTAADLIYLVGYVFKSGPRPCDVCPLLLSGAWRCP